MRVFVLVDLDTQAERLPPEVRTWPPERFLSWLQLSGELVEFDAPRLGYSAGTRLFGFRAPSGLVTSFTLTEQGRFCVSFPHYRVVWPGTAE
jgi:hypothetical protein